MSGTTAPRSTRDRSWWGWGWADAHPDDAECGALGALVPGTLARPLPVPEVADLHIGRPAVQAPRSLASLVTYDPRPRAAHAMGKAYRDVARALRGRPGRIPDLVAHPTCDRHVADLLEWAAEREVAVIPYGGGSSVVGGVEYRGHAHRAVLSLDLTAMDRILEIDTVSRAARVQAGILGPALEARLRPHDLTLRHFPQSFEFSTLGGWLATRAGGHYATVRTHIDDFTQSLSVVTPVGTSTSWRLPASGAGPSPDRLFLGSEGSLGVITEAWMRLQERPRYKASASVSFTDLHAALPAVRVLAQSDLALLPTAVSWTPGRPLWRARRGTAVPCSSSASSPRRRPWASASARHWTWPAPTAGAPTPTRPTRLRPRIRPSARGARPSCACPICGTGSPAWEPSPRPSKRPPHGTGCPR